MITVEEFRKAFGGTNERPVKGSCVIIAEKAVNR